jgi:DNA processing protein
MVEIHRLSPEHIPSKLLSLPKPPKELYVRGNLPDPALKLVTIVGPRNHTRYGKEAVEYIVRGLSSYSVGIVAGLALGIDALAHEYAIQYNLPTYAFPGSGLSPQAIYPATNRGLAERILHSGGGLISEFTPDTKGARWTFPSRNRLMAGIADIVLVIEASYDSGTMITAHTALEYGTSLGAVPGPIFSDQSRGSNHLLKQGALPVTSASDILREFGIPERLTTDTSLEVANLTTVEKAIYTILKDPCSKNQLSEFLGLSISEISIALSLMELKGVAKEESGIVSRL